MVPPPLQVQHPQQGRGGGGTSRRTSASGGTSNGTPDEIPRPPMGVNGGTTTGADDVSASFTNESRELFQHLETLQKQMYDEQHHGEEEEEEDEDEDNGNDHQKNKPLLNVLTSISLLSLQASRLLFWKPASTLLLPELLEALREWYKALAPQTIRIYIKLIPTFINSIVEILSSTSKGNEFLMQIETTIQSLLKTVTTQSSQDVVQTSVTSFVHLINALTTPQAKRATKSFVHNINACQRALSTEEAQSLIRDISELYIRAIDTLGDTTTTSSIAEWSATFCVALEETRQDLVIASSSAEILQPPPAAVQGSAPQNRSCNGEFPATTTGERTTRSTARSQQPQTTNPDAANGLLSTPVRNTTTLARTALGMPTPGSVLTVDEDPEEEEEDSFVKLFQQKFVEQRRQLMKQKRRRKQKKGGGDAMSTTSTVPEVDEDEGLDEEDDAALWEPMPDPSTTIVAARGSPIMQQQSHPTPTSIITTRASNRKKKFKKRIPKYTIVFGCILCCIGFISVVWFVLGLYGMYHIYKGFTTTVPPLSTQDYPFKVIYLTNKHTEHLDGQPLGITETLKQLTQEKIIPTSEMDELLLSTTINPLDGNVKESSILPPSSTLLSQHEEHKEEL